MSGLVFISEYYNIAGEGEKQQRTPREGSGWQIKELL